MITKIKRIGQISVIAFIVGWIFAQPAYTAPSAQTEIPGWLIHENNDYDYQIQYPSTWSVDVTLESSEKNTSEIVIDQRTIFLSNSAPRISVDVWHNDSNKSLQEWFESYQKPLLMPGDLIPSESNAQIANEEAFFSVEFYEERTVANFALLLAHEEYIYRIEYYAIDGGFSADNYRKMLFTLQFSDDAIDNHTDFLPEFPSLETKSITIQEDGCCGYTSLGNPYTCWGGNCVWWAHYKRPDTGDWGHARNWDDRAIQEGYTVRTTPAIGAIAVSNTLGLGEPGSSCYPTPCGHVAYVNSFSSSTVTVSEMNYYSNLPACSSSRIRLNTPYQRSHYQNYIYETPSDTDSPTTTASLSGTVGENNWYSSNVQVSLTAQDNSGGSGVKQIYVKWDDMTDWLWYINPFTVSGEGEHTVYFYAEDNAGNKEIIKQITFGIDTTAPTGNLVINNDASVTHATLVYLNTTATDALSGVSEMRVRNTGGSWSDWFDYTPKYLWQLPGITGQTFSVEAQFRDRVENESAIYSDTIPLDIYPERPVSSNYRLAKSTLGTSGGPGSSSGYRLRGTLGQPSAVSIMTGTQNIANLGYWQAISSPSAVTANFSATPTSGTTPLNVIFTNTSSGNYVSSLWSFGDGITSTLTNPSHTYNEKGDYAVTLTVSGSDGSDTMTRVNYISVEEVAGSKVYLPIVLK